MHSQRERIMGRQKHAKSNTDKPSAPLEKNEDGFTKDAEAIIDGDPADMPALMTKDVSGG